MKTTRRLALIAELNLTSAPALIASVARRPMSHSATVFKRFVVFALATLAVACNGDDAPRTPLGEIQAASGTLPPNHPPLDDGLALSRAARSALDSGNTAFRMKQYDRALGFYRDAARAAPAHASPWFGIFMVAQATGNAVLRDSATREVQKRTINPPRLTDSTLRNTHPSPPKHRTG